jgi:hypothetical protein
MVRLLSFIFFAFIFSCTIIEDGDITSQEEIDNLVFNSIEIEQQANGGTSTSTAKVTSDAVINIPVTDNGINRTITRQLWMDWPALETNSKLKLKSGVTSVFKSYASFLDSGKPWTFYLFDSDTTISDQLCFRYDADGRLRRIITVQSLDYLDTLWDDMVYDTGGKLTSIERSSTNPSKAGTFTLGFWEANSNHEKITESSFLGMTYANSYENSYYAFPSGGASNNSILDIIDVQKRSLSLLDRNNNSNNSGCQCNKWIDTFYFHPLMILKDQFELGDELLFIYMVDWWQPISSVESPNNEKVTFTFRYDL